MSWDTEVLNVGESDVRGSQGVGLFSEGLRPHRPELSVLIERWYICAALSSRRELRAAVEPLGCATERSMVGSR